MSGAERQRRYLERLLGSGKPAPEREQLAQIQSELAQARTRIAELEKLVSAQRDTGDAIQRGKAQQQQQWHKLSPTERRIMDLQANGCQTWLQIVKG